MNRKKWLKARRKGIGGSDVAAILGISKYKSAFGVYVDKVSPVGEEVDNVHTRFGKWLETPIKEEFPKRFFAETGIKILVKEAKGMFVHKTDPFVGTLDGLVEHEAHGEGVLEIKTASERQWKEWEDGDVPGEYYCQVQHYMNLSNLEFSYIVALVGKELLWRYIGRDEKFIKLMVERLRAFWTNHVLAKNPPAPAGFTSDKEVLEALYGEGKEGAVVEVGERFTPMYDRYKEIRNQIKELEKEEAIIKQTFMAEMKEAETLILPNGKATWKTVERKGYEVKPKSFRSFRIW